METQTLGEMCRTLSESDDDCFVGLVLCRVFFVPVCVFFFMVVSKRAYFNRRVSVCMRCVSVTACGPTRYPRGLHAEVNTITTVVVVNPSETRVGICGWRLYSHAFALW